MGARLLSYVRLGRIAACVALGGALLAALAVHFEHGNARADAPASQPPVQNDPLAPELARCRHIGLAAQDDAACAAVWAENRRRFFMIRPPAREPAAPLPSTSEIEGR